MPLSSYLFMIEVTIGDVPFIFGLFSFEPFIFWKYVVGLLITMSVVIFLVMH